MGFFESFGAGLSAVQDQARERNALTQQLLTQLVAQNPALAETPEIQEALRGAFPESQYSGVVGALGSVNQARLGEEARLQGVARGQAEQSLLDQILLGGAQAGIDVEAENYETALDQLTEGVIQKAKTSRSQELVDNLVKHSRAVELAEIRAQNAGAGGKAIAGAIGNAAAGLMGALKTGSGITEVPVPEPGAEEAARLDLELIQNQLVPRFMNLAQIVHLDRALGERSSGVAQLWREHNSDQQGFGRDYGQDWNNAVAYVAANEAQQPGMLEATIGSNPEALAIKDSLVDRTRTYFQSKADERRVSIPQESAFEVVNRAAEATGQPAPFPPGASTDGDVMFPGQGDEVYTQPQVTFELLPPMAQEMYMRGEGINGLNAMYSEIIKIHGFDMESALVDMRDMEQEFIRAGYLEPMYGGQ